MHKYSGVLLMLVLAAADGAGRYGAGGMLAGSNYSYLIVIAASIVKVMNDGA